jgi:hypothetical protein
MPFIPCTATLKSGVRCSHDSKYFMDNLCGTHHNAKVRSDAEYLARYTAWLAQEEARRVEHDNAARELRREDQERRRLADERRAAEETRRRADEARRRRTAELEERRAKFVRYLGDVENTPIILVSSFYETCMTLWNTANIPGYSIPKAYAALRYKSPRHAGFVPLLRAAIRLAQQNPGNHPVHDTYAAIPEAERTAVLAEINAALVAYGDIDLMATLRERDRWLNHIRARMNQEEEQRRREQEAARREAEREQMRIALRERPVVFQRDPEGSINLAAFATDNQSVHRSSVQNATHRAILTLLSRPLIAGQDTLPEIIEAFMAVRFKGANARERTVMELTDDYFNKEAFSIKYGDVLDHVWAYIREHTHKKDLTLRLAQEAAEGIGMCSNGKMARLVNVLQGYDETLESEKPKELFQSAIAILMNRPLEEREAAARSLFVEYAIPEAEQQVWLEPLLEA